MLDAIQNSIVTERNNFGDYSTNGHDLKVAAAAALLIYQKADDHTREKIMKEADVYLEMLMKSCPSIAKMIRD
mgnify:CR=1 FL=1